MNYGIITSQVTQRTGSRCQAAVHPRTQVLAGRQTMVKAKQMLTLVVEVAGEVGHALCVSGVMEGCARFANDHCKLGALPVVCTIALLG